MTKLTLIAAVTAMACYGLPVLAAPALASANDQATVLTSGLSTGTVVAQSTDSDNQNQSNSPAPQSDDNDK